MNGMGMRLQGPGAFPLVAWEMEPTATETLDSDQPNRTKPDQKPLQVVAGAMTLRPIS